MQFRYTAAPNRFNARTLMESVENAYKRRVEAGTWKPMLEGMVNEEIAVLKAMVESNNAEITALKAVQSNGNSGNADKASKWAAHIAKYVWTKIPPADAVAQNTPKMFEDHKYHWCTKHKAWTLHTDAECKGVDYKKGGSGNSNNVAQPQAMVTLTANNTGTGQTTTPNIGPVVKVNEAYQTLVQYCKDFDDEYDWVRSLLVSAGKQLLLMCYNTMCITFFLYGYVNNIVVIGMCLVFNIIAETWLHCFGDQQGILRGYIDHMKGCKFLKCKSRSGYKRHERFKLNTTVPKKFLWIGTLMFLGYSAMQMSNNVYNDTNMDNISRARDDKGCFKSMKYLSFPIKYCMETMSSKVNDVDMDDIVMVYNNTVRFDMDSYPIKLDNFCTQTMTGYKRDFFPSNLVAISGKHVTGFAQTQTKISHIGTV
jgi:hypothetical protein